jgi:hypothetical protein
VNLGGGIRLDEEGNAIPGKMVDMVVEGENVYIVSVRSGPAICSNFFFFCKGGGRGTCPSGCVERDSCLVEKHLVHWAIPTAGRKNSGTGET